MSINRKEDLLKRAYDIISQSSEGILQTDLHKSLKISSKEATQIIRELIKRGIVKREKVLHKGKWTYRLTAKKPEGGLGIIGNLFCLICPLESRCSKDDPKYLIVCRHLEKWAIEKYEEHIEELSSEEK